MATVSQELININKWNLNEIAKLSEKIKNQHGDSNCRSWRYPSSKSGEININLSAITENCSDYTQILELIIDRTIYNLSLVINYLENLEGMTQSKPGKNVLRPDSLSLATILFLLWERIQQLQSLNSQKELSSENLKIVDVSMKTSRLIQTELSKISRCSCCDLVQKFMSRLIFDFEKFLKDESALLLEKDKVKEIVEDMSNWGAMARWLNAITRDVDKILERIENVQRENQMLKNLADNKEKMLKNQILELKSKNKILEEQVKEKESSLKVIKKQVEDLIDEKSKDDNRFAVTIMRLKQVLHEQEKIIKKLGKENAALKKDSCKLSETEPGENREVEIISSDLGKAFENLQDELELNNDFKMNVKSAASNLSENNL